jgi:Lrp/AsnC family transcriptional regulator
MDAKDIRILAILQENSSLSMGEISRRVHLSQTPCWRRIQRLEEAGVIEKRVAILNPQAVGFGISAFVEIHAPDHSEQWYARFSDVVSSMPEVMEVHRMAGEVDYLLRVAVKSMEDYDDFYRRFIARVPTRKVTSRFSMERMKSTTAYPINPAPPPGRL